jgi:peptidoglycan hydrolase-like protein with peptidoglycan-binding domain
MKSGLAVLFITGLLMGTPCFGQSTETIKGVQKALKEKKFYSGPVDGVAGSETRSAIKKYQTQQNLPADGRIGPKTLDSLGVKEASPGTQFKASGENVKQSYGSGGKEIGEGSKAMADDVKGGHVGNAAVDFGKGIGGGVKKMAVGTGHAAKNAGKGVANSVTPDKKATN